jgi:hypothetical protein
MRVKIERINNWLQLSGNAGIIISIIVLAYQVNEANRVSSAQAFQSRAQMGAEITWALADSENIGPIMHKVYELGAPRPEAVDALEPLEQWRLRLFERAAITLYENNLYQCEEGFLDPEFCEAVRGVTVQRAPYWRKAMGGEIPAAFHRVIRVSSDKNREVESDR